jgi:hypothetical protein
MDVYSAAAVGVVQYACHGKHDADAASREEKETDIAALQSGLSSW